MKNNLALIMVCLFIITAIASFYVGATYYGNKVVGSDTIFSTKTDTLWKDTTITETKFVPKIIIKTKTDTLYKENGDTVQLVTESKRFDKSIISDKDTADVEIYTTGINTSLDSLKMRLKTHREVITNTVEVTKYIEKPKTIWDRVKIQPQVTSGYDLINKKWGVTVGIGIGIEI